MRRRDIYLIIICVCSKFPLLLYSNNQIDSLKQLLLTDKEDTAKVIHLNLLCREYVNISNYDTSIYFGKSALQISQQLNFKKGISDSYNNIGTIYFYKGDYRKALENYIVSLNILVENYNTTDLSDGKRQLSIASAYNNIGMIYQMLDDYTNAMKNYLAALKIREKSDDKKSIADSYNNIGIVFSLQKNYNEAIEHFSASLKIRKEMGDKIGVAKTYNNIGIIYKNQENYDDALENYFASLKIEEKMDNKEGIAVSYYNIGVIYNNKMNFSLAITWLQKALQLAKEISANNIIKESCRELSDVSAKTHDYKDAYKYHQLYSQIKDSLFNEENSKQIAEMQAKYETEIKQQEIEKQQIVIERRNYLIYAITGALILFAIIGILINVQLRSKAKRKSVELQQKLLRSQMNPHFIFNALLSIQNYMFERDAENAAIYLSKFASLVWLILDCKYPLFPTGLN